MFRGSKSIRAILYANVVLLLLTTLFPIFHYLLAMYDIRTDMFHFYQLITYQFVHVGFIHLLFNMLAFLTFAPDVESFYGTGNFLIFYFLCGIGSALLHFLFTPLSYNTLAGASGSVFGLMSIFTMLYPNQKFSLFLLPINIKCKWIMIGLLVMEAYGALFSRDNVSHFGHLGGSLTGFLLYLQHKYKIFTLK